MGTEGNMDYGTSRESLLDPARRAHRSFMHGTWIAASQNSVVVVRRALEKHGAAMRNDET